MPGEAVGFIFGVQIVYNNTLRLSCPGQPNPAFFFTGLHIEFIVRFGFKGRNIPLICRGCARENETAGIALSVKYTVSLFLISQPFQMDTFLAGGDAANVDITCIGQQRLIGALAPSVATFHYSCSLY